MKKVTVYIDHLDDDSDFVFMKKWLAKWAAEVIIVDYSTGGWEHCWDLEAPEEAVQEIPEDWLCASYWATPEIFSKK